MPTKEAELPKHEVANETLKRFVACAKQNIHEAKRSHPELASPAVHSHLQAALIFCAKKWIESVEAWDETWQINKSLRDEIAIRDATIERLRDELDGR